MIETNPAQLTKTDEKYRQIGQLANRPQEVTEEELSDMEEWAHQVAETKYEMQKQGRGDEFAEFLHQEMEKALGGRDE